MELRNRNTGVCRKSGKAFEELMDHFILGGDETCLLASDGTVRIIGDTEKRKHEKNLGSPGVSITMYRTGSAAGATGPTLFLPPGAKRKIGFNGDFLTRNDCAPGSTIVMTMTGYMAEEAWLEMAEKTAASDGGRNPSPRASLLQHAAQRRAQGGAGGAAA
jgi:hypothetical protein